MLNTPSNDLILSSEKDPKLAGEKFTNNEQCELVFGNGSKICSYMPPCARLWCSWENEMSGCKTQHMPWADGTECKEGHWCQKGQCVPIDRSALKPQNGGWGAWGSFSDCSRTCGGGIQSRTRKCNSPEPKHGGKYCTGWRIEYRPCNTQPCPNSRYNFRDEQCRARDNQTYDVPSLEPNVRWTAKYGTPLADQCKLLCRVLDKSVYFMLDEKVIDGTPCTFPEDSFDMCINGQCRKAGCDYVLNSDAKLDQCGVCKGDNSTCRQVSGQMHHGKQNTVHKVSADNSMEFHIPVGATNINILHSGYVKDGSFLSLMSGHEIIFNDPKHPTPHTSKHRLFAGVRLEYTVHGSQERITSTYGRVLREKLTVRIIRKMHGGKVYNGQVNYNYMVPIHPAGNTLSNAIYSKHEHESYHHHHHHHHAHHPHHSGNSVQRLQHTVPAPESPYRWEMSSWMKCDQECSGKKRRTAICFNADTQKEVSQDHCNQSVKPQDLYESCNTECKFYWEPGRTECSSPCGEGTKQIEYKCIRLYPQLQRQELVDDPKCSGLPKPLNSREVCIGPCKNATWQYSPWNKVTSKLYNFPCSCSEGTQNRTAKCLSEPNGFLIEDQYCEAKERKATVRPCDVEEHNCPKWVQGELTPCSVTCGEGQRAYALQCMLKNVSVNAALCGARPVPVVLNCTMPSCEQKPMSNTQYSSYRNDVQPNQSMKTVNYQPAPESSPVPRGQWRTYTYSNCSAECDGGIKKRQVHCLSETGQILEDRYCPHPKPVTQINCANVRCPSWTFGQWSKCNDECIRSRQVLCQDHRGKESDQCSTDLKPPAVESCCSFKWRITCSGSCDTEGRRKPHVICKRLFPKSLENPHPLKTGRKVDPKYCANARMPTPMKLKKKCSKPCPFRWVAGNWSEVCSCSVGCGAGWTMRNVTCTDGRTISPKACNAKLKPANTKVCEALTHCRWRVTKPLKCNCKGRQTRTVKCYDEKMKVESNRCSEATRPNQTASCQKPPGCRNRHLEPGVFRNCKDAQRKHRTDGEYTMQINRTRVKIYCYGMRTVSPTEYLSLPKGEKENYAIYSNRRAADSSKCENSRRDWTEESIDYGATHYRKIRLNLATLQVHTNDTRFTKSSGKKQPFGSAGDCYSNTGRCPQGDFAINLEGTPFRIRPSTAWEKAGGNSVMNFLVPLEKPYQKVRARCGGYCGSCFVSRTSNLFLELA
uniref:GON domain-containing protein n=1 Tax=Anopheles epiroticus TaxID=199890 RepID=A0A182PKP9_9DIPT